MATVYLALGSNVGNSSEHFGKAVELLTDKISGIKLAPVYVSKAVGYTDQPDFTNTALVGQTSLSPLDLLKFTQKTEQKVGRVWRFRWGPREIDIDIIFYDNLVMDEPILQIPHARFSERDFVLRPLCDLAPTLVDPISKQTINTLLAKLPASELSILS